MNHAIKRLALELGGHAPLFAVVKVAPEDRHGYSHRAMVHILPIDYAQHCLARLKH